MGAGIETANVNKGPKAPRSQSEVGKDYWYFTYKAPGPAPNHLHVGDIRLAFETVSRPGDR